MAKYASIAEFERKLHRDEPIFPLRAQDALAPAAVEAYAGLLEIASRATVGENSRRLEQAAQAVREEAGRMRNWQAIHPDLVKLPD